CTAWLLVGCWVVRLVPAEPKVGPVYQPITHMVPLWFPVLLIVPAIALDLLRWMMGERWGKLKTGVVAGCVYLAAFVAAQWPFADFLLSPQARNPIFGTIYFGYFDPANLPYDPYRFITRRTSIHFASVIASAFTSCG